MEPMSNGSGSSGTDLPREIERLRAEREELENRIRLLEAELEAQDATPERQNAYCGLNPFLCPQINGNSLSALSPEMIQRYSRHLLLSDFGVEGQLKLSRSSILVVGAGGLGSPAAMYLAACGVGCLGIVDGDIVELNNLHRQIIHKEAYVGESKVKSAASACRAINSSVKVVEHQDALKTANALDIVRQYDVVVDATDNLPSRYMISDCCVFLDKPLISGAALGLEGQLTVYHHNGGPCYRCLFPTPPPAAACQRCSDSGVLGIVPGVIGCLQALEAIKVVCNVGEALSGRMLLFDALSSRFRTVKIRGRSPLCPVCGENAVFTSEIFESFDYENFTQSPMSDKASNTLSLIPETSRISSKEYNEIVNNGEPHVLVDVRPAHHFKITAIPKSINIPLSTLEDKLSTIDSIMKEAGQDSAKCAGLYLVCRRGNDSQRAVHFLSKNGFPLAKDIVGGLQSWAQDVDRTFPTY
ncbi:adenylyltransferase and sulfurtransferase MOCS3-2-like [Zingiber officinale]|uniref:adenylyltransferase and sulfurtransferase MOCS3-2-like n=1 Tax=Zingiber officinale TaxID=94328 RepID=UPI001C4BDF6A|nr:adenylyltransferase and sulfurtransferase MOCS3-2-like [Zingiber officinale]XP_042438149.1 adenylyltransferase and sulfurtransferase MOCS3-2-like [Zingiber officinale]